jgi:hypothetical protein
MKCDDALELISAALDGELTAEERAALDEHLANCPACAALYEELSGQSHLLRELDCHVPEGLSQRILSQLPEQSAPPKKRRRVIHWQKWGALAACAALVVWAGLTLPSHLGRSGSDSSSGAAPVSVNADENGAPTAYTDETDGFYTERNIAGESEPDPNEDAAVSTDSDASGESASSVSAQYFRVTWTEKAAPAAQLISSTDELAELLEQYQNDDLFDATNQYDERFFEGGSLIAVSLTTSSGSVSYVVEDVRAGDNGWEIVIQRNVPEVSTADMAAWLILIETDEAVMPGDQLTVTFTQ